MSLATIGGQWLDLCPTSSKKDGGILVSSDNGDSWEPLGINIPDGTSVKNIAFKDSEIFIILNELRVYRKLSLDLHWKI